MRDLVAGMPQVWYKGRKESLFRADGRRDAPAFPAKQTPPGTGDFLEESVRITERQGSEKEGVRHEQHAAGCGRHDQLLRR